MDNADSDGRVRKSRKYKEQRKETALQKWIGSKIPGPRKDEHKVSQKENLRTNDSNKKRDCDLMPPEMTLPPLEKETYIPDNQLELGWEMSQEFKRVSDKEIQDMMNMDEKDMTIHE